MGKTYVMLWRNKFLTTNCKTVKQMADQLQKAARLLSVMSKDGVRLRDDGGVADDYAILETTDPKLAVRYGMAAER